MKTRLLFVSAAAAVLAAAAFVALRRNPPASEYQPVEVPPLPEPPAPRFLPLETAAADPAMLKKIKEADERKFSGKLRITESPWSGWTEEQPESRFFTIEPVAGKIVVLGDERDDCSLKITGASAESLSLEAKGPLSLKQGEALKESTINLNACQGRHEFFLARGETVELNTCSMDAGIEWMLDYVR